MQQELNLGQLERFCIEHSLRNFNPRHYKESTRAEIHSNVDFPDNPLIVGMFGSAFEKGEVPEEDYQLAIDAANKIAGELSQYSSRLVLVGGFCPDGSIPSLVAERIKEIDESIPVVGISPWKDYSEASSEARSVGKTMINTQKTHDLVIYTDFGSFRMRDGSNCHFVDGAIAMRGSTGTNDELAGLYETGKVAGRLLGFGGSTDAQDDVVKSFIKDGKHHYVELSGMDPNELVRRVIGQINVDHYLKIGQESSSIDVYIHNSSKRGLEPVINIRRFRVRDEDNDWQSANDRAYPFITYDRHDFRHVGKLLAGIDKQTAQEYVHDVLMDAIFETKVYKHGEAGLLLFPKRKIHQDVPVALEHIAQLEQDKTFYHQMNHDKLSA